MLWALNPTRTAQRATIRLSTPWGPFRRAAPFWGDATPAVDGDIVTVEIGARDGIVAHLHR